MKLTLESLALQSEKKIMPLYLISGDENVLNDDAKKIILNAAGKKGFNEVYSVYPENAEDWKNLELAISQVSLFEEKTIYIVRLATLKIPEAIINLIETMLSSEELEKIVVIIAPKISGKDTKLKWVAAVEAKSVWIPIWPKEGKELNTYLLRQAQKIGLKIDPEAISILIEHTRGNLLAARQELEKLALLFEHQVCESQSVISGLTNQNKTSVFEVVDLALGSQKKELINALQVLKQENFEGAILLWAIARELRNLIAAHLSQTKNIPLEQIFAKLRIHFQRKNLFALALKKYSLAKLYQMLLKAEEIDLMIKGIKAENFWPAITELMLGLT